MKPSIDQIREGFDELFLGSKMELTETTADLLQTLGIKDFGEIYIASKKFGFADSQKALADLVKVSFVVYTNLERLPIKKKVILPESDGSYKFVVVSLQEEFLRGPIHPSLADQIGSTAEIYLISTGDDAHAKITDKCGLNGYCAANIFGGARIDIDRTAKKIRAYNDSGSYGSCSNQLVQRMLQEYVEQGYEVIIDMDYQISFFDQYE